MSQEAASPGAPALLVEDLRVWYPPQLAVDGVSLRIEQGEVLALIGETGSGKSSVALAVARLLGSAAVVEGHVELAGHDLGPAGRDELRRIRGTTLGYIAQDAMAALNPVLTVGRQVAEMFEVHRGASAADARRQAVDVLRSTRIADPELVARLYPHQLSGGMRQRAMIAIAIALAPPLLIADEPTTALDVSTQAEILGLVAELRSSLGTGILWITHDMGVVAELADWVAVMYAGRIVERGPVTALFDRPVHPYTDALLRTRRDVRAGRRGTPLYQIAGHPPSLDRDRRGCAFAPRCPRADATCAEQDPEERAVGDERQAACHHPLEAGVAAGVG